MRRNHLLAALLAVGSLAVALVLPAMSGGHPERPTVFPTGTGSVPKHRNRGPTLVVCQRDSRFRIRRIFRNRPTALRHRLAVLRRCKFRNIQTAVNRARTGYRILIMPGVYKEQPSRAVPVGAYRSGPCANDYVVTEGFNDAPPPAGPASNDPPVRPDRNLQVKCPNAKNLIEVTGDPRPEPDPTHPLPARCLQKCNLQISGYGRNPGDVLVQGDRRKADVLRIDRADGIYLSNFTIEQASFNDIDLVEVNGFRVTHVVARYAQNYGILTFTSTHGLYDHIEAYNNGDSGVYPGSNAKGCDVDLNAYGTCEKGATTANPRAGCGQPTTELRQIDSHDNVLGYSGTAGNSTWVHDSHFHDNNTGLTTDSFAAGHPGMPQECFQWEHNVINSNNVNYFTQERQDYCNSHPFVVRPKTIVCPQFQTAVGTGLLIGGGNRNLLRDNYIYDNWRWGVGLIGVPAQLRGDSDPSHQSDTSNGNIFTSNQMGTTPTGARSPNGTDFMWDEQGAGNCWHANTSKSGASRQSNVVGGLPDCPGFAGPPRPGNPATIAMLAPCTAWDPERNPRPVGCDWFDLPPKPQ